MLSILNNGAALEAENQLNITTNKANSALQQLSSGSRINSGSDDAAGLAISDGLNANVAALNQSALNVTDGVGELQTADGAMAQVTSLLNRAVTIATEASNGTVSTTQASAINNEYKALLDEIGNIASNTNYNGQAIFGSTLTLFTSDGTSGGLKNFTVTVTTVAVSTLSLNATSLTTATAAQSALTAITAAISVISADRGNLGGFVEELNAASSVSTTESQNLSSASSDITSADIGQVVAEDTQYSVLEQTGISALQQANQESQNVLKLLQ
jgi:flagellin